MQDYTRSKVNHSKRPELDQLLNQAVMLLSLDSHFDPSQEDAVRKIGKLENYMTEDPVIG